MKKKSAKTSSKKAAPKKMMKRPSKIKATEQQAPVGPPPAPMQQPPQTPVGTPPPGANGPLMKKGGTIKKKAQGGLGMKSVKSGFDKNPGVTRADFVSIGKGTAKSGKTIKKAFLGSMLGGVGSNLLGGTLGGMMGGNKKSGGGGNSNLSRIAMRNTADAMPRPIGGAAKSGKTVKKAGMKNSAMKSGGSMKKCRYGCK